MSQTDARSPMTSAERFLESALFRNVITAIILVNAAILGLQTYDLAPWLATGLVYADKVIIAIFVVEIVFKLLVLRTRFFKSGWNWFDLIVVMISVVPVANTFSVLRALRVLRLFRLFSVIPEMRSVVEALARAIPGMGSIMLVLGVIFYVSSVMGANLFSGTHPQFFGDLGGSAFTLFQIMTLESWSMGVARPVISEHPAAWIFFVGFIVLTSFAVLNLFIAVIVDSMQAKSQGEAHDERELLMAEFKAMREELKQLRLVVEDQGREGSISDPKRSDNSE